jgi:4-amino-4-deoxy-L-arabinose transferase-like glycosyltransferase
VPRIFLAILIIGLLLRLAWSLSRDAHDDAALASLPDQREYLQLGRNLLDGRGLVMRDDRLEVDVYAYRAPGYPTFIALCGGNIRAIRIAQALIDTSTILAAYLLARKYLGAAAGVFASVFVAFNPYLIYFSALILSETLFIALLAWGMFLLTTRRTWWSGSIALAIALLVRPGAMFLPILLAALSSTNRREVILRPLATLAMIALALFPWALRNSRAIDRWIWTTTNTGITLYDGFNPTATGGSDQRFIAAMLDELRGIPNEADRSAFLARKARQYIGENPGRAILLTFRKIARIWSPVPLSDAASGNALLAIVSAIYSVPLFALTLAGIFMRKLSLPAKVYLLGPAIYLTAIHALSVGSLRYRLPADVPMAVVAASLLQRAEVRKKTSESAP